MATSYVLVGRNHRGMAASGERQAVPVSRCFSALVDLRAEQVKHFTDSPQYEECWRMYRSASAAPLSPSNWPSLPHTKKGLKAHVRSAVSPAVRRELWLGMVSVSEDDSVLFAKAFGDPLDHDQPPSQLDMMYGWPYDLDALPSFYLRPTVAQPAFARVLTAVTYTHADTVVCPLLPALTRLLLHFVEEWECYAMLDKLLCRRAWLDQSPSELAASRATFRNLCLSHERAAVQQIQRLCPPDMPEEAFLATLSQHWYTWPFHRQPFWMVVRVVDMYLVEGPKVLYRLGLAALQLFAAHHQTAVPGGDLEEAVPRFLAGLSSGVRASWFEAAFAVPHLPWRLLMRSWAQGQDLSRPGQDGTDGSSGPTPLRLPFYQRSIVPDPTSEIVASDEHWRQMWAWLPEWVTCENPFCVFRASRDGYNLRTLYRKSEDVQPIVLLVRTVKGAVFGAVITSELRERHNVQFFGNGETLLFSLQPEVHCYQWTGETDLILRATEQELAVGSGGGAYGLWVDGDLDRGSTASCLAYHNPPLTGAESQFSCAAIEVYECA